MLLNSLNNNINNGLIQQKSITSFGTIDNNMNNMNKNNNNTNDDGSPSHCDKIFTLCDVFGDVQRLKIS